MIKDLQALAKHWTPTLSELFTEDPDRGRRMVIDAAGIRLDYSKHWITEEHRDRLIEALEGQGFAGHRAAFFAGQAVNTTEQRPALHMALRARAEDRFTLEASGESVTEDVIAIRARAVAFAEAIRCGDRVGVTGKVFTDVLNLGIGGSDLGPLMVARALSPWLTGPRPHYVSNVDGAQLADTLKHLNPETTLVLIASKTFTTQETLHNANKVVAWLTEALGEQAMALHGVALSSRPDLAGAYGIPPEAVFGFSDWVGGRFSLWSSIGLSVMIAVGPQVFEALLEGARAMDHHFQSAPLDANMPVMMGLLGAWYRNGFGMSSHAVLPYSQRLEYLPAFLQQLEMESNGKSVHVDGTPCIHQTAPVIWGAVGTNGQHAFHQLLHQGTDIIPCDFIVAGAPVDSDHPSQALLVQNALAQAEALAFGQSEAVARERLAGAGASSQEQARLAPHQTFPGNRPSSLMLLPAVTPASLGALIAAYEHKVFVQGVIWSINPFDQWGVELGKRMARALAGNGSEAGRFSTSTTEALAWLTQQGS